MRLPVVIASAFAAGVLAGALGAGLAVHPEWFGLSTSAPEAEAAERKRPDADAGRRDGDEARRADEARRQEEEAARRRDDEARRRDEETAGPPGKVSCDSAAPALKGAFATTLDCYYVRRAFSLTLTTARDGAESTWNNARSGLSGTIRVLYTTQEMDGTMCRRFQQSVARGGKELSGVATACFRKNGWHIAG